MGPRALLERHGIPVVHDAPGVGEDLQDHFYCRTFWRCTRPITLNDDMLSLWRQAKIGLQYLLFRRGPLTVSAGYAAAFVRTRPEIPRPDAQIYFINFSTRQARRRAASVLRLHAVGVADPGRVARLGAHRARPTRVSRRRSATTTSPPRTTGA